MFRLMHRGCKLLFLSAALLAVIALSPVPQDSRAKSSAADRLRSTVKPESVISRAPLNPCSILTPDAIQQVIDAIGRSQAKAELDLATYRAGETVDRARENRDDLVAARTKMTELQTWLRNNYSSPYESNNAAYAIFGNMNELVASLNYTRNQAALSFVYHHNANARESFELTSQAIDLAEPLGRQAGRCYMGT